MPGLWLAAAVLAAAAPGQHAPAPLSASDLDPARELVAAGIAQR